MKQVRVNLIIASILSSSLLISCSDKPETQAGVVVPAPVAAPVQELNPEEQQHQASFFWELTKLCGKKFTGRLVAFESADKDAFVDPLIMHVKDCTAEEIRIPFSAGEDRSRTWVITRTANGIRLKHDHRHADGSEDVLSQYGGDTANAGSATRQEFPVDEFSKQLFNEQNRQVSMTNVWAIEIEPEKTFTYELKREGRHFRVEFDLASPMVQSDSP